MPLMPPNQAGGMEQPPGPSGPPPPTGPSEPRGTLVPPAGGPAGAAPPMADQQAEVDPQQVDQFLDKCWQIIYGGDSPEGELSSPVMQMLRGGPEGGQAHDPVQSLADTAATIAARVVSSATEQKFQLDGAAVFIAMLELIGELATDAGTEGIYDYSQEEIDGAATRAGETLYAQTQESGLWPQEEMYADLEGMMQDSESGAMESEMAAMAPEGEVPPGAAAPPGAAPPGAAPPAGAQGAPPDKRLI